MIKISQISIGKEEINAVSEVLNSGMIAQGPKVAEFENKFAEFCGSKYAVAVNSGTAALHCALYACGIKSGDEVITTPFTFIATANSILMQGAKPVFADIESETYDINPAQVEAKITSKTKAILPVDLYGHIYNTDAINKIAVKYGLKVIEDACQSHGARAYDKNAGAVGDAGCFSFYATKNMATGEGGMVTTDNVDVYERARKFRHHGQSMQKNYQYFDIGYNYRMTDIAAAIGLEQLKKLEKFNTARIKNAARLTDGLKNIKGLAVPVVREGYRHVFHQYTIRITPDYKINRDKLAEILKEKGIESRVFYPEPLHMFAHLGNFGYKQGDYPVAERASREVLSLPVNPSVNEQDIDYIIKAIKEI